MMNNVMAPEKERPDSYQDGFDDLSDSFDENENDFMLTTKDNPYDPWSQWDEWYAFDREKGYFTCEFLARIAITSLDMTDEENDLEISRAINEIIAFDFLGIYKRAYRHHTDNV